MIILSSVFFITGMKMPIFVNGMEQHPLKSLQEPLICGNSVFLWGTSKKECRITAGFILLKPSIFSPGLYTFLKNSGKGQKQTMWYRLLCFLPPSLPWKGHDDPVVLPAMNGCSLQGPFCNCQTVFLRWSMLRDVRNLIYWKKLQE